MPKISFIVARTKDGVIGVDNTLPWKLQTDLRRFRKITLNHVVVMGRKTFDSIGKPLPNRINVVVSSTGFKTTNDSVFVCPDLPSAILVADAKTNAIGAKEFFVIGGEQVFRATEEFVEKVYLTEIDADDIKGDAYFSLTFSESNWKIKEKEHVNKSELDDYNYTFIVLERKTKKLSRQDTQRKKYHEHLLLVNS
jgi:dihydrofolate reductase